jgi:uncharacterized protein (DUF1330 family)
VAAYAIGLLEDVEMGPAITEYLDRIDDTFAPFGGRFAVHGGEHRVMEGPSPGVVVVIEFPDLETADAWYHSPAYQAILPLRTEHSRSRVVLLDGVEDGHRATDVLRGSAET